MYEIFAKLLQERHTTAYKVAKATGISNATLSDWKTGRSIPKNDKIVKIAEYFGVSPNYFFGEDERTERKPSVSELKFALFGGDAEYVSDDAYEDVLRFAQIIAEKERRKGKNGTKPNL